MRARETAEVGPITANAPAYLTGAASEELGPQVAEALARPVGKLEPPLRLPAGFPVAEMASNVGIALRGLPLRGLH